MVKISYYLIDAAKTISLHCRRNNLWGGTYCHGLIAMYDSVLFTSVEDIENEVSLEIYPNPCQNNINIKLPKQTPMNDCSVVIYSLEGVKLYHRAFSNELLSLLTIPTDGLANGIYLLELIGQAERYVVKFIVNRQ